MLYSVSVSDGFSPIPHLPGDGVLDPPDAAGGHVGEASDGDLRVFVWDEM